LNVLRSLAYLKNVYLHS